ncbi:hypothetical protein C2W62_43985 [Candidatus Entotheonella serta]|nr:hypothetical protein C2W62_43985 [Candidatus Entotheonella serta]
MANRRVELACISHLTIDRIGTCVRNADAERQITHPGCLVTICTETRPVRKLHDWRIRQTTVARHDACGFLGLGVFSRI